mmetsp:Transcript_23341/g.56596  ORF Transcript_23341/g.56596 Transcript_23341/m.56596 type:complete len:308 (+) Transcript_23341:94-1017(+)
MYKFRQGVTKLSIAFSTAIIFFLWAWVSERIAERFFFSASRSSLDKLESLLLVFTASLYRLFSAGCCISLIFQAWSRFATPTASFSSVSVKLYRLRSFRKAFAFKFPIPRTPAVNFLSNPSKFRVHSPLVLFSTFRCDHTPAKPNFERVSRVKYTLPFNVLLKFVGFRASRRTSGEACSIPISPGCFFVLSVGPRSSSPSSAFSSISILSPFMSGWLAAAYLRVQFCSLTNACKQSPIRSSQFLRAMRPIPSGSARITIPLNPDALSQSLKLVSSFRDLCAPPSTKTSQSTALCTARLSFSPSTTTR